MSILSNLLFYLVGMCLQKLIFISSIANLGYRTPSWQCRRGDEAAEKSPDVGRRYRCNICVSH